MSQRWRGLRSLLRGGRPGTLAVLVALLAALGGAAAWAQPGGITLGWWTIDGGGAVASTSGGLTLSGTIGQADAAGPATAGGLTLEGGFWNRDNGAIAAPPPGRVYLPLVAKDNISGLAADRRADLVTSVRLNPAKTSFAAGEPVEVLITVTNRGAGAAGPFWVDLYLNPSAPPTAANQLWNNRCGLAPCFGIGWPVAAGLAPGQSVTLSSKSPGAGYSIWTGWLAAGTTDIFAYADSWNEGVAAGAVDEASEANNRAELHGLTVTGANPPLASLQSAEELGPRPDPASAAP